jgi:hypothetical protein
MKEIKRAEIYGGGLRNRVENIPFYFAKGQR